jgi:outer membrane protein OmpA-like peptidoglycan-associated protein
MPLLKQTIRYLLAGILSSTLLVTGVAQAERERVPGYVTSPDGTIARGIDGECVRSSDWTPEMAVVVGCDGVVLNAKIKTDKGGPTGRGTAFVIPAATMFAFDSAELTDQGKKELQAYRDKIRPELAQAFAAVIVGHTDSTGDLKHNMGLSKRRAASVRDYLIAGGAPAQKLRTVGMGPKEPIASNDTKEGRATNRRVEVIVFGEARALDVMQFPSVALFPRRSSELTLRGKELLDKNKTEAQEQLARAVYIEVIGHTDDVGDAKENQKLSEQRAKSVRDRLVAQGVDPAKIMTVGVGSSQPIASNQTEEGRAENRRVEVLVLGRLKEKQ